jgi:DNA-binding transcriptional ArsR family regulator
MEASLDEVLRALGDPLRLELVRRIASAGELACACAAEGLTLPKSTLAHHFKVLRQAGVIVTRLEGTQSINTLNRETLDTRFPGLLDAVLSGAEAS